MPQSSLSMPGQAGAGAAVPSRSDPAIIALLGGMFFVFGFVTWLNGPLISFAKLAFDLTDVEAFLVPMAFYMSYLVFALPAAWILRRTGMKRGMALGLLVMAVGALMFGQAVTMRVFGPTLTGLFVIGGGLSLLQTAANPYVSIVGPIGTAARRIAIMGICNKAAGMIAPLVFGLMVLQDVGNLNAAVAAATDPGDRAALLDGFARRIYWPYMGMAVLLAGLAVAVFRSPLPELRGAAAADGGDGDAPGLSRRPMLWLGIVALFLYMGAEVMAGDAIGIYGAGFGIPIEQTVYFTSLTLGGMLAGYVVGLIAIPRFVSQERYLGISAVLGALFVTGAFLTEGYASVAFVAALGFANAMMWPAIFPMAINGLGRHMETGSALLVMAICGGAIVPQAFAMLKEAYPFQSVFAVLMLPIYLYIGFFARFGSRRIRAGHR